MYFNKEEASKKVWCKQKGLEEDQAKLAGSKNSIQFFCLYLQFDGQQGTKSQK